MTVAFVTGSTERISSLAGSLRGQGRDVVAADSRDHIATLAAQMPRRSVSGYVQLLLGPAVPTSWAPPVIERIETVALVAPLLAPRSTVVIVTEDPADPARDLRVADGLRLLAEAALTGGGASGVKVSLLQDGSSEAVSRALLRDTEGWPAPLADLGADREYADWRTDVLNLTSRTDLTYFGWRNQDGQFRVGLLRGSVMSPLTARATVPVAWGKADPGAGTLGRALLAEALGGRDVEEGLVELFVGDVVHSLPADGFELSASEVEAWLRRHLGQDH